MIVPHDNLEVSLESKAKGAAGILGAQIFNHFEFN